MVAGSHRAELTCKQGIVAMKSIICRMGLQINEQKDESGQDVCLLGVLLSTVANGGVSCSAAITNKRRSYISGRCLEMQQWKGPIRVHMIMAFAGLLSFCSQVIPGSRMYLRSAFTMIGSKHRRDWVHLSNQFRTDCSWWRKLVLQSGPCGMLLDRRLLSNFFVAWDASETWGIGGFYAKDHQFFSIPWSAFYGGDIIMWPRPHKKHPLMAHKLYGAICRIYGNSKMGKLPARVHSSVLHW